MIDDTEFSELCCTIDTREKRASRVERIKKFVTSRGGMVAQEPLKLCDYKFEGTFREKEINLGIEFKEFSDFNNSKEDLNWKLFEAGKLYSEVALFVQENNFGLSFTDQGTFVKIPQVPDGSADITNYYGYKNQLDSFSHDGIHVRTFQHEAFFEEDLYGLLIYLSKDCHNGLHIKGKDFMTEYLNTLCKIDGVGAVKAHKFAEVYPNIEQFVNHLHYDGEFEKIAGMLTGKRIRAFLTDSSRADQCMENYRKLFPSPQPNTIHRDEEGNPIGFNHTLQSPQCDPAGTILKKSSFSPRFRQLPADDSYLSLNSPIPQTTPKLSGDDRQGVIAPHLVVKSNDDVIQSLDDAIVDLCYKVPKPDTEIIAAFHYKGYGLIEIHKAMNALSKTKLRKYQDKGVTMYSFCGVRADVDMDVGV